MDINKQGKEILRSCNFCNGRFLISKNMGDNKLLCPHCKQEVIDQKHFNSPKKKDINEIDQTSPQKASIPQNTFKKVASARRTAFSRKELLKKNNSPFSTNSVETKTNRSIPVKRKQSSGFRVFFLIILSISFLAVAGTFYYKTINLPSISKIIDTHKSLLIDTETTNTPYSGKFISIDENELQEKTNSTSTTSPLLKHNSISAEQLDKILANLIAYFTAESTEQKLNYVFDPAATRIAMEKELSKNPSSKTNLLPVQIDNAYILNNGLLVLSVVFNDNSLKPLYFIYDDQKDEWLLDWFSMEPYQTITYQELIASKPKNPVEIKARMCIGANYSPPFEDKASPTNYKGKTYLSLILEFNDNNYLDAYLDKNSPLFPLVIRELASGSKNATLLISYPTEGPQDEKKVLINDILRLNWLGESAEKQVIKFNSIP